MEQFHFHNKFLGESMRSPVEEHLPSMCKVLGSNLNTEKKVTRETQIYILLFLCVFSSARYSVNLDPGPVSSQVPQGRYDYMTSKCVF